MTLREQFEKWWCSAYHPNPNALYKNESGCYVDLSEGMSWDACQAAFQAGYAAAFEEEPEGMYEYKPATATYGIHWLKGVAIPDGTLLYRRKEKQP